MAQVINVVSKLVGKKESPGKSRKVTRKWRITGIREVYAVKEWLRRRKQEMEGQEAGQIIGHDKAVDLSIKCCVRFLSGITNAHVPERIHRAEYSFFF